MSNQDIYKRINELESLVLNWPKLVTIYSSDSWENVPKDWTKADWYDFYNTLNQFIQRLKKRHQNE